MGLPPRAPVRMFGRRRRGRTGAIPRSGTLLDVAACFNAAAAHEAAHFVSGSYARSIRIAPVSSFDIEIVVSLGHVVPMPTSSASLVKLLRILKHASRQPSESRCRAAAYFSRADPDFIAAVIRVLKLARRWWAIVHKI